MPTRTRLLVPATLTLLLTLAACTGGGDDPAGPTSGAGATGQAQPGESSGVRTTDAVLAEQTFDAGASSLNDAAGGQVTTTLRALEVTGETMTLRWAVTWDADEAEDDATTSLSTLGMTSRPQLVDRDHLKQYLPLCTEGEWGIGVPDAECRASALTSPAEPAATDITNHTTIEAWAVFAAPQDEGATFDAVVSDGWPPFAGLTPEVTE